MKRLRRMPWFVACILTAMHGVVAAAVPVQIDALPRQFIEPGCGCTFYTFAGRHAPTPVLRWAYADRRHAMVKLDGEVRQLGLVQEKRLPSATMHQAYGDRLVLIFTDDKFRVEVPSTVTHSCAPEAMRCAATRYKARLIVRREADAPRVVEASGACGC